MMIFFLFLSALLGSALLCWLSIDSLAVSCGALPTLLLVDSLFLFFCFFSFDLGSFDSFFCGGSLLSGAWAWARYSTSSLCPKSDDCIQWQLLFTLYDSVGLGFFKSFSNSFSIIPCLSLSCLSSEMMQS